MTTTTTTDGMDEELNLRKSEEYQMKLFGLHARTVTAAIKQEIKENIDSKCEKLRSSLETKYKPKDEKKRILESNIKNLRKTYRKNMEPYLFQIENIVKRFINVPSNILLEEDKCQAVQYTNDEFGTMQLRLQTLQQDAKRITIFNAALKEEVEIIQRIKESEDLAKKLCRIIDNGLLAKKLSNKTIRTIEKSKDLTMSLDSFKQKTHKEIYNPKINEEEIEKILIDF